MGYRTVPSGMERDIELDLRWQRASVPLKGVEENEINLPVEPAPAEALFKILACPGVGVVQSEVALGAGLQRQGASR